jgi:hypothetical protein
MALPQRVEEIQAIAAPVAALRIRRCTYRRLDRVSDGRESVYAVSCVYPDRSGARHIGDLEASVAICAACAASHIFRPDED